MPTFTAADTLRILVASDSHVGFEERDPIRKDDSWQTFDEIMQLARTQDVDMVLLGGDLFHDNKPSRKSMYQVMRSLRKNCLGNKPCELEFLSDANEVFEGAFSHVNYEDPDINISIPVFSIHGNHDDPSGDGHFCSLDLLQCAGLVNYFGRIPEADNIGAKPVLLQKGHTKLALYGLSNVRDERMFRTFRDQKVKWFRPGQQQTDWFNLLTVHQNHHAHTATGYLPENVLPDWMDLVVWGHEHECLIDPTQNPETGFHVMQPGSSVATSLVPGEAVAKHVAIVSLTGREFKVEKLPLKTVRPFVTRELVLASDARFKGVDKKKENRQELTRRLMEVVDDMIDEATGDWEALHEGSPDAIDPEDRPLPLIRLKVEYTAPEGGKYDCENPQRFSNRFVGRVANTNDVVYFYRKKTSTRTKVSSAEILENAAALENLELNDALKVERLVNEFLAAQSLKILPQAPFGNAVSDFVNKDDKHAMETFLAESLSGQVKQMLNLDPDEDDIEAAMQEGKSKLEQEFERGVLRRQGRRKVVKSKPVDWDSDLYGHWEDQEGVVSYQNRAQGSVLEDEDEDVDVAPAPRRRGAAATTARGKTPTRRGRTAAASRRPHPPSDEEEEDVFMEDAPSPPPARKPTARSRTTTTKKAPAKKAPAKKPAATTARGRARKAQPEPSEDEEEDDDIIIDPAPEEPPPARRRTVATSRTTASPTTTTGRRTAATRASQAPSQSTRATRTAAPRQTKLNFSQQLASQRQVEISADEISEGGEDDDDEDDFETMAPSSRSRRR